MSQLSLPGSEKAKRPGGQGKPDSIVVKHRALGPGISRTNPGSILVYYYQVMSCYYANCKSAVGFKLFPSRARTADLKAGFSGRFLRLGLQMEKPLKAIRTCCPPGSTLRCFESRRGVTSSREVEQGLFCPGSCRVEDSSAHSHTGPGQGWGAHGRPWG